jgi:hypothetical protein
MKQQLLKPWLLIALAFLLVSTVVIRIAEYQLPAAALRLYSEVGERYDTLTKAAPVPDAENALPVYVEANLLMFETLKRFPEGDGYYSRWKIEADPESYQTWELQPVYVLPLPSQPFPDELKAKIQRCVDAYRPVLDKLHYAATLKVPETFWEGDGTGSQLYMERMLFVEALLCILNNDEAGAMTALKAYNELRYAMQNSVYGGYRIRHLASRPPEAFWDIFYYGMERNVFSAASLATLQEMFVPERTIDEDDIVRDFYISQRRSVYWRNRNRIELNLLNKTLVTRPFPLLRSGLLWYEKRMLVHGATAALTGTQAMQRYCLGDASEKLTSIMKQPDRDWYLDYLQISDPFGRFDYLDLDYMTYYSWYVFEDPYYKSVRPSLCRTLIALGRYRAENGVFPENIEALAGDLPETDLNVFRDRRYVYERTDTGWVISRSISKNNDRHKPRIGYPLGTVKKDGSSYF